MNAKEYQGPLDLVPGESAMFKHLNLNGIIFQIIFNLGVTNLTKRLVYIAHQTHFLGSVDIAIVVISTFNDSNLSIRKGCVT